ncbi:hypothetical protein ACHAXR_000033 [Thalassiosira sp. AJA248-18]
MSIYGVGHMPLASCMQETIPEALQPWFADDAAGASWQSCAQGSMPRIFDDAWAKVWLLPGARQMLLHLQS